MSKLDDYEEATVEDLNRSGAMILVHIPDRESAVTLRVPLSILRRWLKD